MAFAPLPSYQPLMPSLLQLPLPAVLLQQPSLEVLADPSHLPPDSAEVCALIILMTWRPNMFPSKYLQQDLPELQRTELSKFRNYILNLIIRTSLLLPVLQLATLLLYRLKFLNIDYAPSEGAEYKLFLAAVMVSHKVLNDSALKCGQWASVSGVSLDNCVKMERELLHAIKFKVGVTMTEWASWVGYFSRVCFAIRQKPFLLTNPILASYHYSLGYSNPGIVSYPSPGSPFTFVR